MAVNHGYGKMAGTGALVFAYDTGDTRNSYKGEPTTNLATDAPSQNGWGGSYSVLESSSKTFQMQLDQAGAATAWRSWYWNVSSYEGSYITISFNFELIETSGADLLYFVMGQGNTGTYPNFIASSAEADKVTDSSGVSRHFTWSGVINAAGLVGCTMRMTNGVSGGYIKFKISNVQIEAKSHETPFVNGTRSATEGLIDLTGNYTFDLSNVSFTSDAMIDFDGTNDFITLDNVDLRPGFTLETVCYPESESFAVWGQGPTIVNRGLHIIATSGYRGFVYGMYGNDCDYQSYFPAVNAWHHWVFTYDGTSFQKRFFADGVEQTPSGNTVQNEWLEGATPLRLGTNYGSGTGYSKANGKIAMAKCYNRPLADTEIQANFNHYKTRFNIA